MDVAKSVLLIAFKSTQKLSAILRVTLKTTQCHQVDISSNLLYHCILGQVFSGAF